ncbi:MAG: hypothetical protein DRJ40_08850 [Thermoprotei archaeon]|nr:MAG: hypothetical protein DRJ40_08850 [Thermoprotei archaeon]
MIEVPHKLKCSKCGNPPQIYYRPAGRYFCRKCFIRFIETKVSAGLPGSGDLYIILPICSLTPLISRVARKRRLRTRGTLLIRPKSVSVPHSVLTEFENPEVVLTRDESEVPCVECFTVATSLRKLGSWHVLGFTAEMLSYVLIASVLTCSLELMRKLLKVDSRGIVLPLSKLRSEDIVMYNRALEYPVVMCTALNKSIVTKFIKEEEMKTPTLHFSTLTSMRVLMKYLRPILKSL